MMKYEIPKEIKSKPKIFGLEIKELVILMISFFLIFTMLKDMVHSFFTIPYFMVTCLLVLWLVMPSRNNPGMKNYMSLFLYFKHDKQTYHILDIHQVLNRQLFSGEDMGERSDRIA